MPPSTAAAEYSAAHFEALFDALNKDGSHFCNRNDICTPMGCVREMVDAIPAAFWRRKNLEILDPCAGNGNFHAYIRNFAPLNSLVFNEINEERIRNIRRLFGRNARITCEDFLHYREDRQYDLIVSNPPYAKFDASGKRVSKNHNLSRLFIEKALRLTKPGGLMLFIVPDNWMSLSDRNRLPALLSAQQFLHLNIHGAKRWFPGVGSSFTWFLLQKTANKRPFAVENNYYARNRAAVSLPSGMDFVPLHLTDAVLGIFTKAFAAPSRQGVQTSSDLHRTTKAHLISDVKTARHAHKLMHTPSTTVWSERAHKYQTGWKVFLSLTSTYQTFVDDCGMTQSVGFIRCDSKKEAQERKAELDTPLFRFLNDMTRYGNFNNIRILQRLPRLEDVRLDQNEQRLLREYRNYVN